MVLAIANGAFRAALLIPWMGEIWGRIVSTVMLCAIIATVAFWTVRWIGPRSNSDAWVVGGLWVVLVLAFEFGAGHYLFRQPWEQLLADYDVARGRVWILVPLITLVAPVWAHRLLSSK
jgi:hypothetical protein